MPDDELFRFECVFCAQRIKVPPDAQGQEVQCPACGKNVRVPSFQEQATPPAAPRQKTRMNPPPKPPEANTQVAATSDRKPVGLLQVVTLFAALFLVVTAGVYCGDRLSHIKTLENGQARYEYRLETFDADHAFFNYGRDMMQDSMSRYEGGSGWELKGVTSAFHKGETKTVLIYGRAAPPLSPSAREFEDKFKNKEIEEAMTNMFREVEDYDKRAFQEELRRAGQ